MDKVLKPERFDASPNSAEAAKQWRHWLITFENFLAALPQQGLNKLRVLVNYVSPDVYELIGEAETYEEAIDTLKALYVKTPNEILARHSLATRKQQTGESLDEYLQALKTLSKDCNFRQVTAVQYRDEAIRDAFISGLISSNIRQRLLENKTLDLQTAFDQARALDIAQKSSESYKLPFLPTAASTRKLSEDKYQKGENSDGTTLASTQSPKCFFCGFDMHPRSKCPARDLTCSNCQKKGHYKRVCRSKRQGEPATAALNRPALATVQTVAAKTLSKACVDITINDKQIKALVDSGSSDCFIHPHIVQSLRLQKHDTNEHVSMATSSLTAKMPGYCIADIKLNDTIYENVKLFILQDLCADIILGQDWQEQHESVTITYGGPVSPLKLCNLTTLNVPPPSLFQYLSADVKPIATKSRKYSEEDQQFIAAETKRLLEEGIIEPSDSPWRAQVVVTKTEGRKKRMVIDYSQTINKFTQLDAYPLPRIDETVNKIAQYRVFSTIDLKSAYHQVPIKQSERQYTAFEANMSLYQFCRVPFGVTNGVAAFQRTMDAFISDESLEDTFAYLDDITICGRDQAHHDRNLERFLTAAKRKNLTYNEEKCVFSTRILSILGCVVSEGEIKPDPERLKPLQQLPPPSDIKSQKRVIGLFSHYSKWIRDFSKKVKPLNQNRKFPIEEEALEAFLSLKKDVESSVVCAIDESQPFELETDDSEFALAATLNQNNRPVAFFSRTLHGSELKHPAIEKEAAAIIEAVRHWKHYLTGKHFKLITDQKSVAFMLDTKHKGKIKNDKILRWRLELSTFSFDIIYRIGAENIPADTLSRVSMSICTGHLGKLHELHTSLCHPGVTRMAHFIKSRNLPYSMEEIREVTRVCKVCAECKPQFFRPEPRYLVKATQPFERLNIDFKGPLPSNNQNKYILTVIDEFSRFPFGFPCKDVSSKTVIQCLCSLFSIFGMPAYIHSDRGSGFMNVELKTFLHQKGIATSRTTSYNPAGNGQVERCNGTVWRAINLALKTHQLPVKYWQEVISDALHSLRSLLCTATNATPHERLFSFQRKSTSGQSMPTWLTKPGPIFLQRHVRNSKFEPLVDEVELIEANPNFAHVRFPDGREDTVSLKHLAPQGNTIPQCQNEIETKESNSSTDLAPIEPELPQTLHQSEPQELRRSERIRRAPDRLGY